MLCRDPAAIERQPAEIYVRDHDGPVTRRIVDQMRLRTVAGSSPTDLHQFYKRSIRLAMNPAGAVAKNGATVTNSVTVNVVGGTPPYSYSCAIVATNFGPVNVLSPTSKTTTFSYSGIADVSATARYTVTDSTGLSQTIDFHVSFTQGSGGGTN